MKSRHHHHHARRSRPSIHSSRPSIHSNRPQHVQSRTSSTYHRPNISISSHRNVSREPSDVYVTSYYNPRHGSRVTIQSSTDSGINQEIKSSDPSLEEEYEKSTPHVKCCWWLLNINELCNLSQKQLLTIILLCLVTMGLGFIICYLTLPCLRISLKTSRDQQWPCDHRSLVSEARMRNITLLDMALDSVSTENMQKDLHAFSSKSHAAWQRRDRELADEIYHRWVNDGLDSVQMLPYTALVSYPDVHHPNKIYLKDQKGKIIFTTSHREISDDDDPFFVDAYNAYSPRKTTTGELLYANYGREEDFTILKLRGISVQGKICLIRYGNIFQGNKLILAQNAGASGVIFFSEPEDVASHGMDVRQEYLRSSMLPPDGIKRGSLLVEMGDPLTPSWPSISGAYRIREEMSTLPKIPTQPISWKDAQFLLSKIGGPEAPHDWQCGFTNITYYLGPGFNDPRLDDQVEMIVNNRQHDHTIFNVIGYIHGTEEPDRYVIHGNHRDAWGHGSSDSISGTVQMLETARILGNLKSRGWRPRRTILFASWAAEELGVFGSQEWVEENLVALMNRGVAYVNSDTCVSGSHLQISASPLLATLVLNAMRLVHFPPKPDKTLAEHFKLDQSMSWVNEITEHLGSGTDLAPFLIHAGMPSVDITFKNSLKKEGTHSTYPTKDTPFDTVYVVENVYDPKYKFHKVCCQLSLSMLIDLSGVRLLPFNLTAISYFMESAYTTLYSDTRFRELKVNLGHLGDSIKAFSKAVKNWNIRLHKEDLMNELRLRQLNDQLTTLEKSFLLQSGIGNHKTRRHALFIPSLHNIYHTNGLSGIVDYVTIAGKTEKMTYIRADAIRKLQKHISDVMIQIRQAVGTLNDML